MEVFKIKISPEVLKKDVVQQSYSGFSFGYYSGMSYILSSGTINLGSWQVLNGEVSTANGLIGGESLLLPLGSSSNNILISKKSILDYDWRLYLRNLKIDSTIRITLASGQSFDFKTTAQTVDISNLNYLSIPVQSVNFVGEVPNGAKVSLTIIQPNTSQLIDLSIPILLKQNYEDMGYYSPFDGDISQLNDDVNFTFTGDPSVNAGQTICVFNTSNYLKNYLKDSTYTISWGDGIVEEVTNFIPESICHDYLPLGIDQDYIISLTGQSNFGVFTVDKKVKIPYTFESITNPYGKVNFITNNGSWVDSPTYQNYIYPFDAINTTTYQQSSNFVSVPFIVSGNTQSRLNELKVYGANEYILYPNIINVSDGVSGYVESISSEFTQYVINDVTYFDFPNGQSIFLISSSGLTKNMLTASAITKYEYLMNVIDQPQIQTYVFIERGKYSAMENFRRIGEVNSAGRLVTYGYGFFDVRNYDDI